MKRVLGLTLLAVLVSGCVTETRVNGKEERSTQRAMDKEAAAKTRTTLALRYLEAGDAEQARRNLDMALELAPRSADVHLTNAYFYQSVRQTERAIESYEKALSIDSSNGDVLNNYGVMLCRDKQFEKADEMFQRALSNPAYVQVAATNENAGLCANSAGDLDRALEYFNNALAYNIRRPKSLMAAADISLQQNKPEQARVYLQRYDSIAQQTPESLFNWIRLESAADNFAEEARYGMELQQQFPNSAQTKRYIANDY